MNDFISEFYEKAQKIDFNVLGLLLNDKRVLTLGSDSKLIGRIFELITSQLLLEICNQYNWKLEETESQTVYPDFTIIKDDNSKIAIDIKTTYRRYLKNGNVANYGFTLGSFASFLRNNTKNIAYPYDQYSSHYVIGFIYDRVPNSKAGVIKEQSETIVPPYTNVEYFIQEKYKIAGDKPGSGNTENIGSISSNNINDFIDGNGIFTSYGETIFEDYWRGYPKYRATHKNYTSFDEYKKIKGLK